MWAKPQEVTPICLLILVTVQDNPNAAHRQHGLQKEENTLRDAEELSSCGYNFRSKFFPYFPCLLGWEYYQSRISQFWGTEIAQLGCLWSVHTRL